MVVPNPINLIKAEKEKQAFNWEDPRVEENPQKNS